MEKIKQEIITIRQLGIRGFNYVRDIKKYHISRKGIAKKNPNFNQWKECGEIRKHIKFDVEVERVKED